MVRIVNAIVLGGYISHATHGALTDTEVLFSDYSTTARKEYTGLLYADQSEAPRGIRLVTNGGGTSDWWLTQKKGSKEEVLEECKQDGGRLGLFSSEAYDDIVNPFEAEKKAISRLLLDGAIDYVWFGQDVGNVVTETAFDISFTVDKLCGATNGLEAKSENCDLEMYGLCEKEATTLDIPRPLSMFQDRFWLEDSPDTCIRKGGRLASMRIPDDKMQALNVLNGESRAQIGLELRATGSGFGPNRWLRPRWDGPPPMIREFGSLYSDGTTNTFALLSWPGKNFPRSEVPKTEMVVNPLATSFEDSAELVENPVSLTVCEDATPAKRVEDAVFWFVNKPETWFDANAKCRANGGYLATVLSDDEQKALARMIGEQGAWIGAQRTKESAINGKWQSQETTMSYTAWLSEDSVTDTLADKEICQWETVLETQDSYHPERLGYIVTGDTNAVNKEWEDTPLPRQVWRYLNNGEEVAIYQATSVSTNDPFDAFENMIGTFSPKNESFKVFRNEEDYRKDVNAQLSCPSTEGVGFPGSCGWGVTASDVTVKGNSGLGRSARFDFCNGKMKAGCVYLSHEDSGKWVFGPCDEKRPYICRQDKPAESIPVIASSASHDFWLGSSESVTCEEAFEICENQGGHVLSPRTSREWSFANKTFDFSSYFWLGARRPSNDVPFLKWHDGSMLYWAFNDTFIDQNVNNCLYVSPNDPYNSWISAPSASSTTAKVACQRERRSNWHSKTLPRVYSSTLVTGLDRPSGDGWTPNYDFYSNRRVPHFGAGYLTILGDGDLAIGDVENGIIRPQNQENFIYTCGAPRITESCTRFGIEPHRPYCELRGTCADIGNRFEKMFGPTSLAASSLSSSVYYSQINVTGSQSVSRIIKQEDASEIGVSTMITPETASKINVPTIRVQVRSEELVLPWINFMAFNKSRPEHLFISDRNLRGIYLIDFDRKSAFKVAGKNDVEPSSTYVNQETSMEDRDIGVPHLLVVSPDSDYLFVASLLVNGEANRDQQYHILRIDISELRPEKTTGSRKGKNDPPQPDLVLKPQDTSNIDSFDGVEVSSGVVYFKYPITGLEIDSSGGMYIAQRDTSSIFFIDLTLMDRLDKFTLPKGVSEDIFRVDSMAMNQKSGTLHVASLNQRSNIASIRELYLPFREDGQPLLWNGELQDCVEEPNFIQYRMHLQAARGYLKDENLEENGQVNPTFGVLLNQALACIMNREIQDDDEESQATILDISQEMIESERISSPQRSVIAHFLQIFRMKLSDLASDILPPKPVPMAATVGAPIVDVSLRAVKAYQKAFDFDLNVNGGFYDMCKIGLATYSVCECGQQYDFVTKKCVDLDGEDLEEMYVRMSSQAYCTTNKEFQNGETTYGTAFMLFRMSECLLNEVWKSRNQKALLAVADIIAISAEAVSSMYEGSSMAGELMSLSQDLSSKRGSLIDSATLMENFNARTVTRLSSVCTRVTCALSGESLASAISDAILRPYLTNEILLLSQQLSESTDLIQEELQDATDTINTNIAALAELTGKLSSKILKTTAKGFASVAKGNLENAKGRLEVAETALTQSKDKFFNSVNAINGDKSLVESALEAMNTATDGLEKITSEFYECKRDQELAALARARLTAIFDVVVGAFQVVAEVGAFILSGGASSAAKSAVKASSKAIAKGKSFMSSITSSFRTSRGKDTASNSGTRPPSDIGKPLEDVDKDDVKDTLTDVLDMLPDSQSSEDNLDDVTDLVQVGFFETDWNDAGDVVQLLAGTFNALEAAGVPGAGGVEKIITGVYALTQYEGQKDEINSSYKASLAKAANAFQKIGEYAAIIGEFFSSIVMEFYQILRGNVPEVSYIESQSLTFWPLIESNMISFLHSTDMYSDFQNAVSRRLLSTDMTNLEQNLLAGKEETNTQFLLRSRAVTGMSTNPNDSFAIRRSLKNKKEDCPLSSYASTGLGHFSTIQDQISKAVLSGTALHERLYQVVQTSRAIELLRVEIRGLKTEIEHWEKANKEFEDISKNETFVETELSNFIDDFAVFTRASPEVQGKRDARVYTMFKELQEDVIGDVCSGVWFFDLNLISACDTRTNSIFTENTAEDQMVALIKMLEDIEDGFQTTTGGVDKTVEWFRIPIATTVEVASNFPGPGNEFAAATAESLYNFSMNELPTDLKGCGYNMEVENQVFLVEGVDDGATRRHVREVETMFDSSAKVSGPFIKLDAEENRHLFVIDQVQLPSSTRARVIPFGTNCEDSMNFDVEDFVLRENNYKVCVELKEDERDQIPLLGQHTLRLGGLAGVINQAREDRVLVMYAKLSVSGLTTNCKANQFTAVDPKESGEENADSTSDWLYATLAVAAVVVVGGGVAFAVRKRAAHGNSKQISSFVNQPDKMKTRYGSPQNIIPEL